MVIFGTLMNLNMVVRTLGFYEERHSSNLNLKEPLFLRVQLRKYSEPSVIRTPDIRTLQYPVTYGRERNCTMHLYLRYPDASVSVSGRAFWVQNRIVTSFYRTPLYLGRLNQALSVKQSLSLLH